MRKEWFGIVALMMVASIVIAGCTSLTNSNQAASTTSTTEPTTATTTTKASVSATPKPTPSPSVVRTAKPAVLVTPTPSLRPTPAASVVPSWHPTPSPTPKVGGSANLKVLFFYKPECPYCQAMEPKVTQLQNTYVGKISVQWVVSAESPMTTQYGVKTVPTLILLNNGNEAGRWVAASDTSGVSAQINSLLGVS